MDENKISFNELVSNLITEATRLGFSGSYIWRTLVIGCGAVRKYYKAHGVVYYNIETTLASLAESEERYVKGELSHNGIIITRNAVRRMNEFFLTGTLQADSTRVTTNYLLRGENERLVEEFIQARGYSGKAGKDAAWVTRKYLYYFEQNGHSSLRTVTIDHVRDFIMDTAAKVKTSTLHDIYLYLHAFHLFLAENGIPAPDCADLFSYTIHREMPIQGCVADDELKKVLSVIDVTTESGARNYAIILLSSTTGLRACDIIRMKLTDINWRNATIQLKQNKTDLTVTVPLLAEPAEAVKRYILKYRPKDTGCPELFLRCSAPKTQISDAVTIGTMFKKYQDLAGVERNPYDGKGFHGLRRRLAKKLLTTGTAAPTIAQILGHADVGSTRQYLVLDNRNLKECALTFDLIPVGREQLKDE